MNDFKITLNKIEWDIKFVAENHDTLDGCRGVCCYRTSTIYISNTLKPTESMACLFHELAHACLAETNYNIELKEHLGDNYERFISLLGLRIIELCQENPLLHYYIRG